MGGCCTTCLNRIDFVSDKYNKSIDRRDTFKTLSGGVLSILMLIFIVSFFFYYSVGILIRTAYEFTLEEYYYPLPISQIRLIFEPSIIPKEDKKEVELQYDPYFNSYESKSNFKFGFKVEDINGTEVDDRRIFDYGFTSIRYNLTSPGYKRSGIKSTDVAYKKCTFINTNLDEKVEEMNYYCPASDFYFGGSWRSDAIAIPIAYVKLCDANTEQKYSVKCLTNTELAKVGRLFFSTAIEKNLINNKNYTNHLQ